MANSDFLNCRGLNKNWYRYTYEVSENLSVGHSGVFKANFFLLESLAVMGIA